MYVSLQVALVFGVTGACRKDELTNIKLQDLESHGNLLLVKIPNTKTSTPRSFTISDEFLKIVSKYQELRPAKTTTDRFFINYRNGKCTVQVVGKNKFGNMPKEITTFLNLPNPDNYTGHCFRRTSATVLADSGANLTTLKRHGGWKSSTVAEGYIEEAVKNKSKIETAISSAINLESTNGFNNNNLEPATKKQKLDDGVNSEEIQITESTMTNSVQNNKFFHLDNCTNITINYNENNSF